MWHLAFYNVDVPCWHLALYNLHVQPFVSSHFVLSVADEEHQHLPRSVSRSRNGSWLVAAYAARVCANRWFNREVD
jgi:hypothetical protein